LRIRNAGTPAPGVAMAPHSRATFRPIWDEIFRRAGSASRPRCSIPRRSTP